MSAILVGVVACGPSPDDPDTGIDAPLDVPRDVPADAPSDAGAAVLEMGPGFGSCPDWAGIAETVAAGLPADPTPRVLWRWSARDDAAWTAGGGRGETQITSLARSPDGRVFVLTGSATRSVAVLDDAGALDDVSPVPGAGNIAPMAALPDGRAAIVSLDASESDLVGPVALVVLGRDGSPEPIQVVGGEARASSPTDLISLAVGPEGRLYLAASNWVIATCQGSELAWRIDFSFEVRVSSMFVDPDGNVWLNDNALPGGVWPIRISPDGVISAPITPPAPAPADAPARVGWLGDELRFLVGAGRDEWAIASRDGDVTEAFALAGSDGSTGDMDAAGGVWLVDPSRGHLLRYTAAGLVFDVVPDLYPSVFGALADGSLLRTLAPTEPHVGVEDPATGIERWRVPLVDPAGVTSGMTSQPVIRPDGIAYLTNSNSVFALQVDRLPPAPPFCLGRGCGNSRMDGAAAPFIR